MRKDAPQETRPESTPLRSGDTQLIVIASTFTADLLQHPLGFWMERLDVSADVAMALYGQVMQQLLDPSSSFAQNKSGFNVLLIRLEDWIHAGGERPEQTLNHVHKVVREFLAAVGVLQGRTSAQTLVFLCPSSSSMPVALARTLKEIEQDLCVQMRGSQRLHCWTHADLVRLYPVAAYEDPRADQLGHIPYTSEYFVAIATLLARRIAALLKPRHKVIAIDCDNTLWKGVCGEDGAAGVELMPAHLKLQRLLVRQHDAGVLLCLCSKNNASDVEAVFRSRPEMPLREEHIVCSRVNWHAKSWNLQSLSEELGLSLDSFVLIDDSPMECAEVRLSCPSVLTLQFPQDARESEHFLDHVWAFDIVSVTKEAKGRTAQYIQNRARDKAREEMASLEDFLSSLELQVDVSPIESDQFGRVAELIQRTNQFNLTSIRRSASEIEALWNTGEIEIFVIHVRDRFGDYGLVGALFVRKGPSSIDLDTFVLSCRVLGRGVEHRVLNTLGRIAREEARSIVVTRYRQTARNAPAWTFLEQSFSQFRDWREGTDHSFEQVTFAVPAGYAESLKHQAISESETAQHAAGVQSKSTGERKFSTEWHGEAYRLSRLSDIVEEVRRSLAAENHSHGEYLAPRTLEEQAVASIWADVLGLDEVSLHADFFQLGGNSLRAVQAIARIGAVLGAELSVYEFFERPTVAAIAEKLAGASQAGIPIENIDRSRPIPLSWSQLRLWFIHQLESGSTAYHVPLGIRFHGSLDQAALRGALDALLERHEALRTVFATVDGEPFQEVLPAAGFALQAIDLRTWPAEQREAEVSRQSRDEMAASFNLSAGPLIRGRLLRLSDNEYVLLIVMHHIASDGWSLGVLLRELGVLYESYHEARQNPLPSLVIQYADYANWQRQRATSTEYGAQLAYWKEHLQGAPELLELPTDRQRPAVQSYRGGTQRVSLGSDLLADLRALSRHLNLTLAMTLYTAWAIILSRLSGQKDIVVGMPVANRRRVELEGVVGFFANTLAVRIRLEDDPCIEDLLQRVKGIMLGAYANQDAPFEQVVEVLQPARSLSHSPVFQVIFVLQNTPRGVLQLPNLTLEEQQVPQHTAQFDLTLSLQESSNEIHGSLNYATDLFDDATIIRWIGYFEVVLRGMVLEQELQVSRLCWIHETERRRVIESFNATEVVYPKDRTIQQLFEEQVERVPDALAVQHEELALTYAELNAKANQLAHYLREQGVGVGEPIPILMRRCLQMVIAELAVLKSGGVYVPVDPAFPVERQAFIVSDCGARRILADRAVRAGFEYGSVQWIDCVELADRLEHSPKVNVSLQIAAPPPAYVMYTSGSTGVPKGVVVPHRAVSRLVINSGYARINATDCVAHCSNPAFDASTFEVWGALLNGARLLIVTQSIVLEPAHLENLLRRERVTVLWLTAGLFSQYTEALATVFGQLRYLLTGGDIVEPEAARRVLRRSPPGNLLNGYGPTECTTFSATHLIGAVNRDQTSIPIGRPIANTRIYILDEHLQPVPIGVTGELFIGGEGLAVGYLNRPALTAERFIPDPFSADGEARLYRTGDLGRWRVDGTIDFLGRRDQQVKMRGFRIEVGEIEAHLRRHSLVKEVAVILREDVAGEKRLVAYIIHSDKAPSNVPDLRAHLNAALPEYMVPSAFVILDRLPLTSNGKLNRLALPAPELAAYARREYEAPNPGMEELLARIWKELLRVERVGRQDNFFELGGHSLLATRVVSRIRDVLQMELPVAAIFDAPTVKQLSARIAAEDHRQAAQEPLWMDGLADKLRREIDEMQDEEVLARIAELEEEFGNTDRGAEIRVRAEQGE